MKDFFSENNIKTIYDLFDYIVKNIKYGWADENGNSKLGVNNSDDYRLQSPSMLVKTKHGICFDRTELLRSFCELNKIKYKTFFLVYYNGKDYPAHSFLAIKENDEWKRIDTTGVLLSGEDKGIYTFNRVEEMIKDIKIRFIKCIIKEKFEGKNFCCYEYSKPNYGINSLHFYNHCEKGKMFE